MEGRVVVSFRAIGGPGRGFLERARSLITRLTPLGGVLVVWDALKLTFAFDKSQFIELLEIAIKPGPDTQGEEPLWAVGFAQGDVKPVQMDIEGSPLAASGLLWWGPPIVAASALAGLARPGEILCAQTISALRAGELVTSGLRIARDGTLRVRGARIDRRQPWKRMARENLTRMQEPRLFYTHLPQIKVEPGHVVVLRADPGGGGTRFLKEIAAKSQRSLIVSPVGSGYEPYGALRRALGRSIGRDISPLLLELAGPLDALLAGRGIKLEAASKIVTAFLWPKQTGSSAALIIDDARFVDPATLEACVRAVRSLPSIGIVARLDATHSLPPMLAALPQAAEHELPSLSREGAEDVAVGATGGALDAMARGRWARRGGGNPLAIVEAVTQGIASGDIAWSVDSNKATPRSRAAGRGVVRPAAKWIRQRANAETTSVRATLSLLAVMGGEAKIATLTKVFETAGVRVDIPTTLAYVEKSRWVITSQKGYVAFPSRTHRDALFSTLEDETKKRLHEAIARVLEDEEGVFGRVESAWHDAQAGQGAAAAKAMLDGARATADAHLESSTTQLIAFARRADPSCEEAALDLLANAIQRTPSVIPSAVSMPPPQPTPAPATTPSVPPFAAGPPSPRLQPQQRQSLPPQTVQTGPTSHASIPASRASVIPPRSGPSRVAAIASVPPTPHSTKTRGQQSVVPAAPPPPPPPPPASQPQALPPGVQDDLDEDSMVEHARIVAPDHLEDSLRHTTDDDGWTMDDGEAPAHHHDESPLAASVADPTNGDAGAGAGALGAVGDAGFASSPNDTTNSAAFSSNPNNTGFSSNPGFASAPPSPSAPGSQIAVRLGELAKDALIHADNAALERWVDGLRAAGESPAFTERIHAMARLGRGDIGDALRVLRRTRAQLDPKDHRRRCQTSLALGVALSVAGRPQEALLEGMDALARARQIEDDRGAKACLAFLAKLYTSVQREEADRLREGSS